MSECADVAPLGLLSLLATGLVRHGRGVTLLLLLLWVMVIQVVEFSNRGYQIGRIFA